MSTLNIPSLCIKPDQQEFAVKWTLSVNALLCRLAIIFTYDICELIYALINTKDTFDHKWAMTYI